MPSYRGITPSSVHLSKYGMCIRSLISKAKNSPSMYFHIPNEQHVALNILSSIKGISSTKKEQNDYEN